MKGLKIQYLPVSIIILITILLLNVFYRMDNNHEGALDMDRHTEIKIDHTIIGIGKVKRYGLAEAKFKIINNGKIPLVISNVKVDCHCTVVDWSKAPVTSHDSTYITVRYDTSLPGYFLKKVTVYSNAENSPVLLVIRGEVIL